MKTLLDVCVSVCVHLIPKYHVYPIIISIFDITMLIHEYTTIWCMAENSGAALFCKRSRFSFSLSSDNLSTSSKADIQTMYLIDILSKFDPDCVGSMVGCSRSRLDMIYRTCRVWLLLSAPFNNSFPFGLSSNSMLVMNINAEETHEKQINHNIHRDTQ